jgi:hypothetical protein
MAEHKPKRAVKTPHGIADKRLSGRGRNVVRTVGGMYSPGDMNMSIFSDRRRNGTGKKAF